MKDALLWIVPLLSFGGLAAIVAWLYQAFGPGEDTHFDEE